MRKRSRGNNIFPRMFSHNLRLLRGQDKLGRNVRIREDQERFSCEAYLRLRGPLLQYRPMQKALGLSINEVTILGGGGQ